MWAKTERRGPLFVLLVLFLFVIPFCSSLPLRWNATFTYEHKTKRKMGLLLAHRPNFARKVVQNSKSLFVDGHDRWFIYSVASDVDGAMLSANLCASLLRHNIDACSLVGLSPEATNWWTNNTLPSNSIIIPFHEEFNWCLTLDRFTDLRGIPNLESVFKNLQGIVLARSLLFMDVLFEGINTWMLDGDISVELDPRRSFLAKDKDLNVLINIGTYLQEGVNYKNEAFRAGSYSFPVIQTTTTLGGQREHATLNNGVVSSRSTPESLLFWEQEFDAMFNHEIGDPQNPFNKQMFNWGLVLRPGGGDDTFYEGTCRIPSSLKNKKKKNNKQKQKQKLRVRGILSSGPLGGPPSSHVVHVVGVSGMAATQKPKIDWMKENGYWYLKDG